MITASILQMMKQTYSVWVTAQGHLLVNGFESHSWTPKPGLLLCSYTASDLPVTSLILFQTLPLVIFVELEKIKKKKKSPLELLPMYKMIFGVMLQILFSQWKISIFRIFELYCLVQRIENCFANLRITLNNYNKLMFCHKMLFIQKIIINIYKVIINIYKIF